MSIHCHELIRVFGDVGVNGPLHSLWIRAGHGSTGAGDEVGRATAKYKRTSFPKASISWSVGLNHFCSYASQTASPGLIKPCRASS